MRRFLLPVAVSGLMVAACGDDTGTGGAGGEGGSTTSTTKATTGGSPTTTTNSSSSSSSSSTSSTGMEACGDGSVGANEACDDGNTAAGDGCDADCAVEAGWLCDGEPSVCVAECGDGTVLGDEACDDGNTDGDDGCADDCTVEMGWSCDDGMPSICTPNCGDGTISGMEECDDQNNADEDGCSAACVVENGFNCTGQPSVCMSTCGDGLVAVNEACDDGNTADADGCSATCNVEAGYDCTGEPSVCGLLGSCVAPIAVPGDGFVFQAPGGIDSYGDDLDFEDASCATDNSDPSGKPDVVFSVDLLAGETLHVADSGASDVLMHVITGACASATPCAASFDGIGDTEITPGLTYTSASAQTVLVVIDSWNASSATASVDLLFEISACGDGDVISGETCDDGNTTAGDGCSPTCQPEAGFVCTGSPSDCVAGSCADPIVVTGPTFAFAGTNINQYNDDENYNAGATCVDATTTPSGFDLVFRADLQAGQTLRVRELGGLDSLIHIFSGGMCGAGMACASSIDAGETTGVTFSAAAAGPVYFVVESWGNPSATTTFDIRADISTCGDGAITSVEACDDGNTTPGDGCSATCTVETGFLCEGTPSACFNYTACTTAACYLGPCTGGTIVTGAASGLPALIPDNQPSTGTSFPIAFASTGTVRSISVAYDVTTTWCADFNLYLTGPNGGTESNLCTGNGGSADNFVDTFLRDGVPTAITSGTAPFTGVYRPETAFSVFNGQPVSGNWTFRVADSGSGDDVTLTSLDIAICVDP